MSKFELNKKLVHIACGEYETKEDMLKELVVAFREYSEELEEWNKRLIGIIVKNGMEK